MLPAALFPANLPGAQSVHEVLRAEEPRFANRPASHDSHAELRVMSVCFPAGQSLQADLAAPALVWSYLPSGQSWHMVRSIPTPWNCPTGHRTHEVVGSDAYLPTGQPSMRTHLIAPSCSENSPRGQSSHMLSPKNCWYWPAAHSLHSLAEDKSVYLPEGHISHVSVPETEVLYAPGGHRGAQFLGRWRRAPYCPDGHVLHVSGMRRRLPEAAADMRYLPSGQIIHES